MAEQANHRPQPLPPVVFQMPLHYPNYSRADYEKMPETTLDRLLASYGLPLTGDLAMKRDSAIGHFVWPSDENSSCETTEEMKNGGGGGGGGSARTFFFQMPLHYPRYTRDDYERMPEWKLDCLLLSYGVPVNGDLLEKREFAMGAFLWA